MKKKTPVLALWKAERDLGCIEFLGASCFECKSLTYLFPTEK